MDREIDDAQLFSWIDRDAPELAEWVAAHPDEEARVAELRLALGRARDGSQPLPAAIGPFKIVRRLGRGGMGVVYEAEQKEPRRRVALKVVAGARDPALTRRLERECDALARLNHPGIAQLFATGSTESGEPYLVMELVSGRPLAELQPSDWPQRRRLEFFVELCDAVAHAHAQGVVHRDLKPANVLVTEESRPKVVDFGLALLQSDPDPTRLTRTGQSLGTIAYASPEQLRGRECDARSDLFSLGAMLFELLTGILPVEVKGLDLVHALRAICDEPPRSPRALDRTIARPLEAIVLHCLEKEPARRYANAGELRDDLRRFLAGEPIVARPPSGFERTLRFARRHRNATVALVLLVGGAAAGLALRPRHATNYTERLVGKGYARTAPFERLRWIGETPQIEWNGRWQELRAIDGLRTDLILAFCKQTAGDNWVKRFSEDLAEVFERMTGRPPGSTVTLRLADLESGSEHDERSVAMTEEKRDRLYRDRHTVPFDALRVVRRGDARTIEIDLDGESFELLATNGIETATLFRKEALMQGLAYEQLAAISFIDGFEHVALRPAPPTFDLKLRRLADGAEVERRDVPRRTLRASESPAK